MPKDGRRTPAHASGDPVDRLARAVGLEHGPALVRGDGSPWADDLQATFAPGSAVARIAKAPGHGDVAALGTRHGAGSGSVVFSSAALW